VGRYGTDSAALRRYLCLLDDGAVRPTLRPPLKALFELNATLLHVGKELFSYVTLTKLKPKLPSWTVAIIVAAMAPLTGAAISGGQILAEKERGHAELDLAKAKQRHDFRMAYFEKAISGPTDQREATLRFLAASFEDTELRSWALEELVSSHAAITEVGKRCAESCIQNISPPIGLSREAEKQFANDAVRSCFEDCQRLKPALFRSLGREGRGAANPKVPSSAQEVSPQ
jgi:hypothetical protein